MFSSSSQRIFINSSCSHQIPIKFLLFSLLCKIGWWAWRWTVRLMKDSSWVLNGTPQFMGRPKGEPQWKIDICRVWQSKKSGFSAYQVLWKITCRSSSHTVVCDASSFMCTTHLPHLGLMSFAYLLITRSPNKLSHSYNYRGREKGSEQTSNEKSTLTTIMEERKEANKQAMRKD